MKPMEEATVEELRARTELWRALKLVVDQFGMALLKENNPLRSMGGSDAESTARQARSEGAEQRAQRQTR